MRSVLLVLLTVFLAAAAQLPFIKLANSLDECSRKTDADVKCVFELKTELDGASSYIDVVTEIKDKVKNIKDGLILVNGILSSATVIPYAGVAAKALKLALKTVSPTIDSAYATIAKVEAKMAPLRDKLDKGSKGCDKAIGSLGAVKKVCDLGEQSIELAGNCVMAMTNGNLKTSLLGGIETLVIVADPLVSKLNIAFGKTARVCTAFHNSVQVIKSWPKLQEVREQLNQFYKRVEDVINVFKNVKAGLEKQFCDDVVFDMCFSGQQIIDKAQNAVDNVKSALKPFTDKVSKWFSFLNLSPPDFDLPGLPNFDVLSNINLNLDLPDVSFPIDYDQVTGTVRQFDWECGYEIADFCNGTSVNQLIDFASRCGVVLKT